MTLFWSGEAGKLGNQSGLFDKPQLRRHIIFDRGYRNSEQDRQELGTLGLEPTILTAGKSQTTTQSEFATSSSTISYRLYGFSAYGV